MFQESSGGGMGVRDATISGSRLLLVDDDPALLLALSGTLQNRLGPCTVDACESGMQALDLVKAHPYDTIISDVRMPGMNGWQFLRAVKQSRSDTPVFLMSGSADHAVMKEALEAGATGFFAKPFDRDEFVRTVREGLVLSRLKSMQAMEHALISRAECHHATLVEKLHQHDGAYAMLAANTHVPGTPQPVDPAWQRRIDYRSTVVRHMAILNKFLLNLTEIHSRTSSRLSAVQENIRRHVLTSLLGR
jgi:CheY-like chemotaxis protein